MQTLDARRLPARQQASELLSKKIFQRRIIQHGVGLKSLQSHVLVFQHLRILCLRHVHAAALRFSFVNAGVTDTVFAAQIGDSDPGFVLLQYRDFSMCSSLKRLCFILWPSQKARAYSKPDKPQGATSMPNIACHHVLWSALVASVSDETLDEARRLTESRKPV
jgi:hypothetical protein